MASLLLDISLLKEGSFDGFEGPSSVSAEKLIQLKQRSRSSAIQIPLQPAQKAISPNSDLVRGAQPIQSFLSTQVSGLQAESLTPKTGVI